MGYPINNNFFATFPQCCKSCWRDLGRFRLVCRLQGHMEPTCVWESRVVGPICPKCVTPFVSDGWVIYVKCETANLTNKRCRSCKPYPIDWSGSWSQMASSFFFRCSKLLFSLFIFLLIDLYITACTNNMY